MQAYAVARPEPATLAFISCCLIGIEVLAELYFQ
jgi:hypothetical protein